MRVGLDSSRRDDFPLALTGVDGLEPVEESGDGDGVRSGGSGDWLEEDEERGLRRGAEGDGSME